MGTKTKYAMGRLNETQLLNYGFVMTPGESNNRKFMGSVGSLFCFFALVFKYDEIIGYGLHSLFCLASAFMFVTGKFQLPR